MKRKPILIILAFLWSMTIAAQNTMRIHYSDGNHSDIPISSIDSISFVDSTPSEEEATLAGTWVWANRERGYYEVINFNDDFTYTGYDNYFTYGFDTQTFGFYSNYGVMLTLWSNGYGYQWRYQWFITALTQNALGVMTRNGPFTYYRLLPDVLRISMSGDIISMPDGTTILFTDGVTLTTTDDGSLQPLLPGTTYIIMYNADTNLTWARKVIVG